MPNPKPTERRFFLCTGHVVRPSELYKNQEKHKDAHILGELRYMTDEGRKVTALALYETPVSAMTVPPVKPVILVYIIGDARLIKCRYADCTKSQRWELGRAGFLSLMDRMGYQDKFLAMENEEETMCADCGHSKSRHETAGGFCKHCPCNEFKKKEEVKDATK